MSDQIRSISQCLVCRGPMRFVRSNYVSPGDDETSPLAWLRWQCRNCEASHDRIRDAVERAAGEGKQRELNTNEHPQAET